MKHWLRHISAISATTRRRFLQGLFRLPLYPRPVFTHKPTGGDATAREGTDETFRKGDVTTRLLSTAGVRAGRQAGETVRELLPPGPETNNLSSAVETLLWLGGKWEGVFPLDVYWGDAHAGFRTAHEWVHYGVASRRTAIDFLLAPSETVGEDVETVFVMHCSIARETAPTDQVF